MSAVASYAHDLPPRIDARCLDQPPLRAGWQPRVQIDHPALLPEEGVDIPVSRVCPADDLPGRVDGGGETGGAAQRAQVGYFAILPQESVDGLRRLRIHLRSADHLTVLIDGRGDIVLPAERRNGLPFAVPVQEGIKIRSPMPGNAGYLAVIVDARRGAVIRSRRRAQRLHFAILECESIEVVVARQGRADHLSPAIDPCPQTVAASQRA